MSKARALETLKKTLAGPETSADDERGVGGDESVSEALSKAVFSSYTPSCTAVNRGIPHPGQSSLSPCCSLSLSRTLINSLQLPVTAYAIPDEDYAPYLANRARKVNICD